MTSKLNDLQVISLSMTQYNQNLKVEDKLLAAVVHFSEDSIIITDTQLDLSGPHIVYVNPGFTKMTGYSPEEVLGKTPRILHGPKTDRTVLERLKATIKSGKVFYGQAINYRKDGTEFWNEWHIEPIKDEQGNITHYIAIQHDISERKRSEQAIEQKNAALAEILMQIEFEKSKIKEGVAMNVEQVLLPALKKIRRKGTALDKKYIDVLEKNLKDMTSSFGIKVSDKQIKLSPREVEIANLIKSGITSKEIVDMLSISFKTVETHRNRIRKKLGITRKDVNLTTYLKTL